MQDTTQSSASSFADHGDGISLGLARMHDYREIEPRGQRELRGEGATLQIPRRVVVMVVQPAFPDRDGACAEQTGKRVDIARRVEVRCIVRV